MPREAATTRRGAGAGGEGRAAWPLTRSTRAAAGSGGAAQRLEGRKDLLELELELQRIRFRGPGLKNCALSAGQPGGVRRDLLNPIKRRTGRVTA
nr:unnamed protein product [Digitaria exilis]